MDFERDWNIDAAADRQQAPDPELAAMAARVKGAPHQPGTMHTVVADANGVVVLPAGTDINQIEVAGRNLVVTLPDGTQLVILEGAVAVPRLVVGDVEIPSVNLVALLIGEEPQPAAGPPRSSGGNFLADDGAIGDPFGLGDLLPPTELQFTQLEEREVLPIAPDEDEDHFPELEVPTSGSGTVVDEAGLGTDNRPGESPGSNEPASVETTSGTITYVALDVPATITINGQVVTNPGQTIVGANGTLTITSVAPGSVGYTYTVTDNTTGDNVTDNFTVTVTDVDGDSVTKTLVINIADDVPEAIDDAAQQGAEGAPVVIDALANDVFGADGVDIDNNPSARVTIVSGPAAGAVVYNPTTGLFTFTPAPGQEGTASFIYQIEDGDGDTSQATVTITLQPDSTPTVEVDARADTVVHESALNPDGSQASSMAETAAGTLIVATGNDTVGSLIVNNVDVTNGGTVSGTYGTLTITGSPATGYSYSYTLETATVGDDTEDSFAVTVIDSDGDPATTTLTIDIVDDVPQALDDAGGTLTEDVAGSLSGNVLTNDVSGADTPKSFVAWGADAAAVAELNSYGTLVQNGDGSWSYVLDNSLAATQALGSGFSKVFTLNYTMEDADGDQSPAQLTITVKGAADGASVVTAAATGPDATVHEAGLPSGTLADGSHVTSGSFTVSATDGIANIVVGGTVFTLAQMQAFGTTNGVVNTGEGTLRLTGYNAGTGAVSYSYTLSATIDNDNKPGATLTEFDDSIALSVNGVGGTTASDTLIVRIVDDVPQAVDDVGGTLTEDVAGSLSGNVLTNDVSGADTPKSFVAWGADAAAVAELNSYGTLVQNGDGSWSYVLDNSLAATQALGSGFSKVFTLNYTMEDADGDQSPAQLTITVKGAADGASVVTAAATGPDATVHEAGLPSGTLADGSHVTSGSFTVSATDGIANIVVGGTVFTLAQMQAFGTTNGVVNTGEGTLRLTGYNAGTGAVSYSYTLSATIDNDNKPGATLTEFDDSIALSVNGVGGTTASDTLIVRIVDDVPQAVDDVGGTLTEDVAGSLSGNVLTNDVSGADTPKAFVAWGADAAAVAELNSYGTLVQNGDGSWSYVLDNSRAATQALGSGFSKAFTLNYVMEDADGDQSPAQLTITVKGAADGASVVTAAATGPDDTVYEAGLPSGSLNDGSHVTTGSFTVSATDGIANIVVGGTVFTLAQMQAFGTTNGVVNTGEGTLRLTGYNAGTGAVSYSYTLSATIDNDSKFGATLTEFDDSIALAVNGVGGTSASDTLIVRIVDDAPQAVDDAGGTLTEDVAGSLSGNVLTNDVSGADTPKAFVAWGADAAAVAELNSYGTLVQNGDGSWSYVLDNSRAATQALGSGFSKVFTLNYTMEDADGDQSPAQLVITVKGAADGASVVTAAATGPDDTVYEAGLPTGSLNDGSHVTSGSFTVSATDGIANIVVGGVVFTLAQMQAFGTTNGVVNTGEGTLRLTGYNAGTGAVSYSYTLSATIDNDSKFGATLTEFDDSIALAVNGVGGTSASDTLIVRIVDDAPQAVDDAGGTLTEDVAGSLSGNVLTNDVSGADTPKAFVAWGADAAAVAELNSYGTLVQNGDGSWSYVLDNNRAATQALGSGFSKVFTLNYTMEDADGDQSPAQLVITVKGAADGASVVTAAATGPDDTVYEAGLPSGTLADGSHVTSGSFTVSATDGIANIVVGGTVFTLAQMQAFGTTNGVVNTGEGTLRLTGYDAGTGAVSYSYTLSATIDNDSKFGATLTEFDDSIALAVNGVGGTTASDTLIVRIVDDAPVAFAPISTTLTNAAGQSATRGLDVDSSVNNNVGADQTGTLTFANIVNGQDTALKSGGTMIELWLSNGGTTLQGRTGSTNGTDGTPIYTIQLDQAAGAYTTTIHQAIDNGSGALFNDLSGGVAGNPPFKLVASSTADSLEILFTPISNQASPSVNSDSDDIGVDGQFIDITNPDAGLRLDFGDFTYDANGGGVSDDAFVIVNHQTINGFKFTIDQISSGTTADVRLKAINADEDGNVEQQVINPAGDTTLNITMVKIYNAAGALIGTATGDTNFGNINVDFEVGGTVAITGLSAQYKVQTYTASGYDRIEITNSGTSGGTDGKFSLSQLQVETTQTGNPVNLGFDLSLTDADGDTVTVTNAISITANPVPPIALDLDGDGLEFLSLSAGVHHDYGAGLVNTAWVAPDDGLLAHTIGGTYDIVFSDDAPGAASDLEGLRLAYDSNRDGVFDARDAAFGEFGVWQDRNSNGQVDAGEFKLLADAGIASIGLNSDGQSYQAAGGDVTVLGEATFVRTNGSTGTVGDVLFATAPKDSEAAKAAESTTSSFNQALVAASLVAVAGATYAVEPEPAPVTTDQQTATAAAPASTVTTEPEMTVTETDAPISLASTTDQDSDQPVDQSSHGVEDPAPDHSSLADGGDTAPADTVDMADAAQPELGGHEMLLAQSVDLPTFDGSAAVLAAVHEATPAAIDQLVSDAIGTADTPNIDALLAALPGGDHAPLLFNPVAPEAVDSGHLAAAAAVFDAAMAAHEAMAVAHG
ncbi:VCBS domain-containing protein [Sphingobium vermicomposti]|uniref:VCBS repeat-containing protein n=1 Tax=Sphingobium vermicomposti TaxID=529005 RepID=A0A846M9X9_9SPHN|nr:VCBS domain-containing protein [Sphingobium vermicomposti]NIJ16934.1 VCBS repeat-containing protein [Sphingobium vermicomposti]